MTGSKITNLSPLLHFTGRDEKGNCATFIDCQDLVTAAGTFDGFADFQQSGVQKIKNLDITRPNNVGEAVKFDYCPLEIIEGTFPGHVSCYEAEIKEIRGLTVTAPRFAYAPISKLRKETTADLSISTIPELKR